MSKGLNIGLVLFLLLGLAGCAGLPFSRPASLPALTGLVDNQSLVPTRPAIAGAGGKRLAVVLSRTTGFSRDFNDAQRRQYGAWISQFHLAHLATDGDAVFSDDRLMSALFASLRRTFQEVRLVRDIPEGFESGADYVGVLDLDLNQELLSSFPSQRQKHTANVSLLFIDPELVAGPLVSARVEQDQSTKAKGADGNIRDTLYAVKTARTRMLGDFEADFARKVSR